MARQHELTSLMDCLQPLEAWVWPLTAAIVVGGALVLASIAGMFWLATHPTRQATVIWMQPATAQADETEQAAAAPSADNWENRPDAHTN